MFVIKDCAGNYLSFEFCQLKWGENEKDSYVFDRLVDAKKCLFTISYFLSASAKVYRRVETTTYDYVEQK